MLLPHAWIDLGIPGGLPILCLHSLLPPKESKGEADLLCLLWASLRLEVIENL